ncbi:DUF4142 domain-containing protein [Pontibacter vulgaris]|uniref:DUF4142 domain-containing protein n=1 Tax=Pontibacter vulgaris TaxID=2905679 RepID=UPI001FA7AEC6|nr:DUF4142 domain-containing protein [Pontibacter vulgaris]
MKKLIMAVVYLAGTSIFTACNTDSGKKEEAGETTTTTAPADTTADTTATAAPMDTTLTNEQKEFIGEAYEHTQLQLALAKVAAQKGVSAEIKQYGQKITQLYTTRQKELADMAKQHNLTLPTAMDDDDQEDVKKLTATTTDKFDKAYWDSAIEAQQDAIEDFDEVIKDVPQNNMAPFNLWVQNARKEMQAQMEQAMRFRLDLKK